MTYQNASNWQDSANINHTPRSLQTILSISQTPLPPYEMHFETIILLVLLSVLWGALNKKALLVYCWPKYFQQVK